MQKTEIHVPDENDSFSRVSLMGKPFTLRFSWNDTGGFWSFGVYDSQKKPLLAGLKITPGIPLNLFYPDKGLPEGWFGVFTRLDKIGRKDFLEGKAQFCFLWEQERSV